MSSIRCFDYLDEFQEIRADVMQAIERALRSGRLILGPEVEAFEHQFAELLGDGACVGVASGTDALSVSLLAAGIGPGDEVVVPANAPIPSASAVARLGATPVFCDVDRSTALMTPDSVAAALSSNTRAVIAVHLYGNAVDISSLVDILESRSIFLLEDCAQCAGGTLDGQPLGSLGDAAAFSFYPTKNLGAYGDAGLCFSGDPKLAQEMRSVRRYGVSKRDWAVRPGLNSRMDEIHAAILQVKLRRLRQNVERRQLLAKLYDERLPSWLGRVTTTPKCVHARHLYVVTAPERDSLRAALAERGIETGIHYPHPLHQMPAFARDAVASYPNAEWLCNNVLSLPLHPGLSQADIKAVCQALADCRPT